MIVDKSTMFYLKLYNNSKDKPESEVTGLLEQLDKPARAMLGQMLVSHYKKVAR